MKVQIIYRLTLLSIFSGHLCRTDSCDVARTIKQTLWPVHCVMDTEDAELSPELTIEPNDIIVKKGQDCEVIISQT